jgi:hypothetical protein
MLAGKDLLIVPKKMIVQSWRSSAWKKTDSDSILILNFSKTASGARVDLVQAKVPRTTARGSPRAGRSITGTRGGVSGETSGAAIPSEAHAGARPSGGRNTTVSEL